MTDSEPLLCHSCKSPLARISNVPPSPIPHLVRTNKAPSDAEAQVTRVSITAARRDITHLDAGIAHARRVLDRLTEEREALQKHVNDHVGCLSPVRRVPAEIWSEIFLLCLPKGAGLLDQSCVSLALLEFYSSWSLPTFLLRVCHDWTTIALSSPQLWSRICLFPGLRLSETALQSLLRRSDQAALSVMITPYYLADYGTVLSFFQSSVVRILFEQSHRWRAVRMTLPVADYQHVFSSLRNNLPELEELHLNCEFMPDSRLSLSQDFDIFRNAPKLRRFTIYDALPFSISNVKLPWVQLTNFATEEPQRMKDLVTLLRLAPNLVEVKWILARHHDVPLDASMRVEHRCLRVLNLRVEGSDPLIDRLTLPFLRELFISASAPPWTFPQFECFVSQSCQALETLRFKLPTSSRWNLVGSQLAACVKGLPSVTHLFVVLYGVTLLYPPLNEFLKALCYTTERENPVVFPGLKRITLKLECEQLYEGCSLMKNFIDVVESRWRQIPTRSNQDEVSRIKAASFVIPPTKSLDVTLAEIERIQTLRSEGVVVEVPEIRITSSGTDLE